MMTLRQRIFTISGIVVGLIIALVLVAVLDDDPALEETSTQSERDGNVHVRVEIDSEGFESFEDPSQGAFPDYGPDEQAARQASRIFVERFSSFSNQNQNSHIEDAMALATDNMSTWLETQRVEMSTSYDGVTTNVQAIQVRDLSTSKATVGVSTQRTFLSKDGKESVEQQDGRVELTKIGGQWKVNGFYWE